jgi:tetratricopeptide (TPR) repeat protein
VDSALFEFKQIDTLLLTKEERAYYDLLKVQAMWKAYIPVSSDTLLDSCLSYYEHAGDVEKLARTCYYKGVLLNDEGHVNEAVEHLKRAERMAGELNDLSFSNKVYTSMSLVNSQAGEHEVALQYAKKTVDSSKKLNSISMLLNDMADLAICYYRVDMKDSAVWWLEQCLPLIENANNNDKSHLLGSLGLMYKK